MLSLSAMSVIATDAFWAAERRGLEAMMVARWWHSGDNKQMKGCFLMCRGCCQLDWGKVASLVDEMG